MGKLRKVSSVAPLTAFETTGCEGVSLINSRNRIYNILPSYGCVYFHFLWFSEIDNGAIYIRHKTYYGYNMRVHFSAFFFFPGITLLDISQHYTYDIRFFNSEMKTCCACVIHLIIIWWKIYSKSNKWIGKLIFIFMIIFTIHSKCIFFSFSLRNLMYIKYNQSGEYVRSFSAESYPHPHPHPHCDNPFIHISVVALETTYIHLITYTE